MSAGELSDYSACVVLHVKGENAYILDVLRDRLDFPDLRRKVIEVHRRWRSCYQQLRAADRKQGFGHELDPGPEAREGIRAIEVKPTERKDHAHECPHG